MTRSESKYFRTSVKMEEALIAELSEKSFAYITVQDICKRAGVNRSTFYLHYENTRDLLQETVRHLLDTFIACFSENMAESISRLSLCKLTELNFITEEYLYPYLSYVRENRRVYATVLSQGDLMGVEGIFERMFRHIFSPILNRFRYPAEDHRYVMMFYLQGIQGVITEWLKEECVRPIPDIIQILCTCVFGLEGNTNPER